jgi:hypothetical protein
MTSCAAGTSALEFFKQPDRSSITPGAATQADFVMRISSCPAVKSVAEPKFTPLQHEMLHTARVEVA